MSSEREHQPSSQKNEHMPYGKGSGGEGERAVVKTPEEFGAQQKAGHDDSKAITEAIEAAITEAIANGTNYAEVLFKAGTYFCERETVKGGTTKGNSQIPLPVMPVIGPGMTLVLRGLQDASPISYFESTSLARRGAVIRTTLTGQSFNAEWGAPSILGGPTPQGIGVGWSNMLVVVNGLTIEAPKNPTLVGCDFRKIAEANVPNMALRVQATPTELAAEKPSHELGIGLYMPIANNGNNANIGVLTAEGWYYGAAISDHCSITRLLAVYSHSGLFIAEPTLHSQGAVIRYLSIVNAVNGIEAAETEGATFPLEVLLYQAEEISGESIVDKKNVLVGQVNFNEGQNGASPKVSGATRLRIIDLNKPQGAATGAPAPESGVATKNPYWRDAFVTISGAEKVSVDGAEQASTAAVLVPTGKSITPTKKAAEALAWKWTLA